MMTCKLSFTPRYEISRISRQIAGLRNYNREYAGVMIVVRGLLAHGQTKCLHNTDF